jgi:hypothetical protein
MRILTTYRRITLALIGVILAALAVSCSSDPEGTVVATVPAPPVVLENARVAMAEVPQFEFELTHPKGTTALDGGLELRRAEGAVIAPKQLSVLAEANLGRLFVKVEAIVIDGQTWMTNPITGNWSTIAPQDSPFSFLDPVRLVTNVLDQTTEPTFTGDPGVGTGNLTLDGKVPSEALQPLVGIVLPGAVLDVALSVDAETFLLKTARLSGRLQADDDEDFVRLITFSGFEDELVIEPPI